MKSKFILAFIISFALAAISASASYSGGGANEGTTIEISKFNFIPHEVRVHAGHPVKWLNKDVFVHTVTSGVVEKGRRETVKRPDGKFDSGDMKQDGAYTVTFKEKGVYLYYCDTHPFMEGKIIVD